MKYRAYIEKDPHWDDVDLARAKEYLIQKIATMGDFDLDAIRRTVSFSEKENFQESTYLLATFESRTDLHIMWPYESMH